MAQGHFWEGWLSLACPLGGCEWHQQSPEGRFWLTLSQERLSGCTNQTRGTTKTQRSLGCGAGEGHGAGVLHHPSLGDISSQLLLPPRLSMSGGGGDLLLECFGSGSPSNVRAVTTGKVPKEALLNRSWLGACCFQALPGASLGTGGTRIPAGLGSRRCWDKPPALHPLPSGRLRVTGVPGGRWHLRGQGRVPVVLRVCGGEEAEEPSVASPWQTLLFLLK